MACLGVRWRKLTCVGSLPSRKALPLCSSLCCSLIKRASGPPSLATVSVSLETTPMPVFRDQPASQRVIPLCLSTGAQYVPRARAGCCEAPCHAFGSLGAPLSSQQRPLAATRRSFCANGVVLPISFNLPALFEHPRLPLSLLLAPPSPSPLAVHEAPLRRSSSPPFPPPRRRPTALALRQRFRQRLARTRPNPVLPQLPPPASRSQPPPLRTTDAGHGQK